MLRDSQRDFYQNIHWFQHEQQQTHGFSPAPCSALDDSHIQTPEVMPKRSKLSFWVSGNPELSMPSEFCINTMKPIFFFSVLLRHKYISHTYISIVHNILFYFILLPHMGDTPPHHLLWVNLGLSEGMWETVYPGWSCQTWFLMRLAHVLGRRKKHIV